jgi:hypothetical protein
MLQSAATKRYACLDAEEVDLHSEHPTTFALAPVKDVRFSELGQSRAVFHNVLFMYWSSYWAHV